MAAAARRPSFPSLPVMLAGGGACLALASLVLWLALRSRASPTTPPPHRAPSGETLPARAERPAAPGSPAAPIAPAAAPNAAALALDEESAVDDAPAAADPDPQGGLTRADVVAAINGVRPGLAHCPKEPPLMGVVRMMVSSSGRVAGVQLVGGLSGTPGGECVERVARAASFKPSRREQTLVSWPIALGHGAVADDVDELAAQLPLEPARSHPLRRRRR